MKSERLLAASGNIDDGLTYNAVTNQPKQKTPVLLKWGAVAACLCVVVAVGIFMVSTTRDGGTVIRNYTASSSGLYPAPSPGKIMYTAEVMAAREHYRNQDVTFLLTFDLFNDGEEQLSEEEKMEEYERLISEGYELYTAECWTYHGEGEKSYYTVVVGYFTEDDLVDFTGNPEYGYLFRFASNGDGSSICVDEKDLITGFTATDPITGEASGAS